MRYRHTMVRIRNIEESLDFYCQNLGLREVARRDYPKGRFTLIFLAAPEQEDAQLELTFNWDPDPELDKGRGKNGMSGRNFGHLAYQVDHIYTLCEKLMKAGITIHRPPRDGHMAFIRSPDGISIELLQKGTALAPCEPWLSMKNQGTW